MEKSRRNAATNDDSRARATSIAASTAGTVVVERGSTFPCEPHEHHFDDEPRAFEPFNCAD